jgi:hypothetical protein
VLAVEVVFDLRSETVSKEEVRPGLPVSRGTRSPYLMVGPEPCIRYGLAL